MRRPYEMNNVRSSVSDWSVFGFLFLVLSTIYAPVLLTSYAFYDDYVNLAAAIQGNSSEFLIKKTIEGRPLHAVLSSYISFPRVGDMADLRYLRFVGIVGLSVLAWSVFRVLVRTGWRGVSVGLRVRNYRHPPFLPGLYGMGDNRILSLFCAHFGSRFYSRRAGLQEPALFPENRVWGRGKLRLVGSPQHSPVHRHVFLGVCCGDGIEAGHRDP